MLSEPALSFGSHISRRLGSICWRLNNNLLENCGYLQLQTLKYGQTPPLCSKVRVGCHYSGKPGYVRRWNFRLKLLWHSWYLHLSCTSWSTQKLLNLARIGSNHSRKLALFAGDIILPMDKRSTVVDIYDYRTNSWTVTNIPIGRSHCAAATIGNLAFFAGGILVWTQHHHHLIWLILFCEWMHEKVDKQSFSFSVNFFAFRIFVES